MKLIIIHTILCAVVLLSCKKTNTNIHEKTIIYKPDDTKENNPIENLTIIKIVNKTHDFGVVKADTIIQAIYEIINTGDNKLIIYDIIPDCICTDHDITKNIVNPNESTEIKLNYNTKDKVGSQKVYATFTANTETRIYKLALKVFVENDNFDL